MKNIELKRMLLDYELRSSWWAQYVGISWLQDLAATYFAWKVNRKYQLWQESLDRRELAQVIYKIIGP